MSTCAQLATSGSNGRICPAFVTQMLLQPQPQPIDCGSRREMAILATELLNLHVRRCFEEFGGEGLSDVFSANWIYNVYNEVTVGNGAPKVVAELREIETLN